jgi:hypothetical protein
MTAPAQRLLPDIVRDEALERVLMIAALIGDEAKDEVNISYTSLLIGLLWSGDIVSGWLEEQSVSLKADLKAVYDHRGITEGQRAAILARANSGEWPSLRTDPVSVSAKTVLTEAVSIARESGLGLSEPIGTRHVAAVYFFRNPSGHDTQFHKEWSFDREAWRRAFAEFITLEFSQEARLWYQILAGYVGEVSSNGGIPGSVLGSYAFDSEAIVALRTLEASLAYRTPQLLSSEGLLDTMAGLRSIPDCASLAELVAHQLGVKDAVVAVSKPFTQSGSSFPATHGFKNVLDRSRTLSRETTGAEKIGVRHIIASMLVAADSTANQRLAKSGVGVPLIRAKLLKEFTRRWSTDDPTKWRFLLVGLTPTIITPFNADTAERGEDRLDVDRYAEAFAIVMAAQKVEPPLSIGIFGDWGSGKSFFMRLIDEQAQKIAKNPAKDPDGKRLFCERVVPIRFNAWQYAEEHLWASLVQTILQQLRKAIVGAKDESALMDKILTKLELARSARSEAEQRLEKARAEYDISIQKLNDARYQVTQKAEAIAKVSTSEIVAAIHQTVLPDAKVRDALNVAAEYLGVEKAKELSEEYRKTAGEFLDVLKDARVTAMRAQSAWRWLGRAPVSTSDLIWLLGVSVVVLGAGAFVAIRYGKELGGAWSAIYPALVEIGAVVAMVTGWAKRSLGKVSRGLDQFEHVRQEIDSKINEKKEEVRKEMQVVEAEHEKAEATVREAEAKVVATVQEIQHAEQELKDSRSIQRIGRLVEERLNSKNYEQHLGIVASVRADFQTLSDLMKAMHKEPALQIAGERPIDRIVLYIDDLDRCPSEKVVAVLEAIHLILAFELFVVVVGVDVRWVARSLTEKYPNHLSLAMFSGRQAKSTDGVDDFAGVSALDYIEKIFQIPFWLPPMEEDAGRNMIAEMIPPPQEEGLPPSESDTSSSPSPPVQANSAKAREASPTSEARPVEAAEVTSQPQLLNIEPAEREFMLSLAGGGGQIATPTEAVC